MLINPFPCIEELSAKARQPGPGMALEDRRIIDVCPIRHRKC